MPSFDQQPLLFEQNFAPDITLLPCDPWIAASALQKAIRRSDTVTAQRAALTCLEAGRDVWRRLIVIAFEDIGVGSEEAVAEVTEVVAELKVEKRSKHDIALLFHLVRRLAEAPKDRSADYLICAAMHHPPLAQMRDICGSATQSERFSIVKGANHSLSERAVAAWYASGLGCRFNPSREREQARALAEFYRDADISPRLVEATEMACRLTREPIVALVPLIQMEVRKDLTRIIESPTPAYATFNGIPSYAMDKHTRSGRKAVQRLIWESPALRGILEEAVPEYRWRDAALMAAFYADGVPTRLRLDWFQSQALEDYGREVDFARAGIAKDYIAAMSEAMASSLGILDTIRCAFTPWRSS
ncbi:hypothetical protein [Microvirga flavescens]|uniref:hypothetical protein n=1 Tax=Microvirga flavescens TaxID=2249811 RepID=UPI000DD6BB0C|nr:hypothetical protein [Microvirga flavescens]